MKRTLKKVGILAVVFIVSAVIYFVAAQNTMEKENTVCVSYTHLMNLAGAEIEFQEVEDKEKLLRNYLDEIRDEYDFILIDCPPSLNILTINALTAADTVLVPIQCEYYALEGLGQVLKTVDLVKRKLNPGLELEGVVFTMYDARTNLSLEVVENVKSNLNRTIYKTIIPRNVRLAEAPSHGMSINQYDTRSTGAESYRMLAAEVMSRGEDL